MIEYLELSPKAEVTDRFGITRKIYGCSVTGRTLFFERIIQLATLITETGDNFQQAYDGSERIQYLVCEALRLNNLDPDWFTLYQVEQLLLATEDDREGILLRVNKPDESKLKNDKDKKAESATTEEILASISTHFGTDLKGALEIAGKLPADFLLSILEARNYLAAPPKEKAKKKMRDNKDHLKKQLSKVQTGEVKGIPEDGGSEDQT